MITGILVLLLSAAPALGRSITDEAGRTVTAPANPRRIVSLAPSITEMLFALGAGDRVVGVTEFSNYPPAARTRPRVGSYVNLNLERIVALRPDLVIAIKDGNPRVVVERLDALSIPTYVINPRSLEEVLQTLSSLGDLVGAEATAAGLVAELRARIRRVRTLVAARGQPRVFYQIGIDPIVSAGRGTFVDELIRTAGGDNVTGTMPGYPILSVEQVLVFQPEIMFITSMARQGTFKDMQRFWQQWPGLPAVENQRIYLVDSDILDRPSPRLVTGLEYLARFIHPEVYPPGAQ